MSESPSVHLSLLRTIVGEKLSSVEFVEDYVQLRFDGATLTAYAQPSVRRPDSQLGWDSPGYRDALCGQIRAKVASVDIRADDKVEVLFNNQVSIEVSLRSEDCKGVEAVMFRAVTGETFVI